MNGLVAKSGKASTREGRASSTVTAGRVEEALPQALFRVRLRHGNTIIASLGGVARQTMVRVLPGEEVTVEPSPFDPSRGRITGKVTGT